MDDGDGGAISTSVEKKELGAKCRGLRKTYARIETSLLQGSLLQRSCDSSETKSGIFQMKTVGTTSAASGAGTL
jgi:hypothetical protein